MRSKLFKFSTVVAAGGALVAGLAATASAAPVAPFRAPSWHTVVSVPNTGTNHFTDVIATGRTTGWAFMANGTAYERTSATGWKKAAFPGTDLGIGAAGASSPSDVWVAGVGEAGTKSSVLHWNGRKWTVARTLANGASFSAVDVLSPNDVWLFGGYGPLGSSGLSHFNGHRWTTVSTTVSAGTVLSDRNIWVTQGAKIQHFDGRRWTTASLAKLLPSSMQGRTSVLSGVLAVAPGGIYVTGVADTSVVNRTLALLHYNGRTWSRVAQAPGYTGGQLASDGKGGLWIASGLDGVPSREGTLGQLFHYSAGRLAKVTLPGNAAAITVSRVPGTAQALAGGVAYGDPHAPSVIVQYS